MSAAYVIAGLVYAASVGFGIAGVALLFSPWTNLFIVLLGPILVLLCIASRPRPAEPPHYLVSRSDFPVLYQLSDRIAMAMGAATVYGIAVSADFGANYRVAGWRQRRYVELGSPLMAILTPQERVAIIAHELSHGANGDPLRGQFLFGAVSTLSTWAIAMRPTSIGNLGEGMPFGPFVSLLGVPFELLMLAASEFVFLLIKGFLLLVLRQSQRAEYLADLLAATVAGSEELQRALEKTYLFDVVDSAIRTHALTTPDDPIGSKLAEAVEALPRSEFDRYRAESRALSWQVDSTHPPTAMRIDMLAAHKQHKPSSLLSQEELSALDVEVMRLVSSTQRELINRRLEAIYG